VSKSKVKSLQSQTTQISNSLVEARDEDSDTIPVRSLKKNATKASMTKEKATTKKRDQKEQSKVFYSSKLHITPLSSLKID